MSTDIQIASPESTERPLAFPAISKPPERPDSYRLAHQALRGRYGITIALGLIFAVAGAWVGYQMAPPVYRSEGLVRIAYTLPPVMQQTDQTGPIAMFDAFMRTQEAVVTSRRVIDLAVKSDVWKTTTMKVSPETVDFLASNLKAEHPMGTEYLRISILNKDPAIAAAAVRSVIEAYASTYSTHDTRSEQQRLATLMDRRKELETQLASLQEQIHKATAEGGGSADLGPRYDVAARQAADLKAKLDEIQLALAVRKQAAMPGQSAVQPETRRLSVREIAQVDPTLRDYLVNRERLEDLLTQLRFNYGERHPSMAQTRKNMELLDERIARYADEYRDAHPAGGQPNPALGVAQAMTMRSVQSLESEQSALDRLYKQAVGEMVSLSAKRQQFDNQKASADRLASELDEIRRRTDLLTVESTMGSRLDIINRGEVPVTPMRDIRAQAATLGAVLGAAIPLMLALSIGLTSRRYRFSDEAEQIGANVPLLGILPDLSQKDDDPVLTSEAARCMHHIRVMIQVNQCRHGRQIFMVASSTAGSGKTGLTMGLGLSFAAAGFRTLIIDCDMVARALTHRLKATGFTGLRDALAAGSLRNHVREAVKGLFYLPIGQLDLGEGWALSLPAMRKLLEEARDSYDVILIDTGPVFGSVEPTALAREVDAVVFAVSRGEQRPMVEKAVRHLELIGANIAGIVFNRVRVKDFSHSSYASSRTPCGGNHRPRGAQAGPVENGAAAFGPLVSSVAHFMPAEDKESTTPS